MCEPIDKKLTFRASQVNFIRHINGFIFMEEFLMIYQCWTVLDCYDFLYAA